MRRARWLGEIELMRMREERAGLAARIEQLPPRSIRRLVLELRQSELTRRVLEQEAARPPEPDEGQELKYWQK